MDESWLMFAADLPDTVSAFISIKIAPSKRVSAAGILIGFPFSAKQITQRKQIGVFSWKNSRLKTSECTAAGLVTREHLLEYGKQRRPGGLSVATEERVTD